MQRRKEARVLVGSEVAGLLHSVTWSTCRDAGFYFGFSTVFILHCSWSHISYNRTTLMNSQNLCRLLEVVIELLLVLLSSIHLRTIAPPQQVNLPCSCGSYHAASSLVSGGIPTAQWAFDTYSKGKGSGKHVYR